MRQQAWCVEKRSCSSSAAIRAFVRCVWDAWAITRVINPERRCIRSAASNEMTYPKEEENENMPPFPWWRAMHIAFFFLLMEYVDDPLSFPLFSFVWIASCLKTYRWVFLSSPLNMIDSTSCGCQVEVASVNASIVLTTKRSYVHYSACYTSAHFPRKVRKVRRDRSRKVNFGGPLVANANIRCTSAVAWKK